MQWVTTRHIHMDRVASPWLIRRFIDADAQFSFVPWFGGFKGPPGAIQFAIPGADIGPHDAEGTCFSKLIRKYDIADGAVAEIAQVVAAGVNYVLHGYRPPEDDRYGQIAVGLLAISDGMMMVRDGDQDVFDASMVVYDALHARFKTELLMAQLDCAPPDHRSFGPGPRTEFFKALLLDNP
ncbi:MAG: hypothetical protein JWN99_1324 [Ilumatobacteraceae bacterium]|nr:hypothetical protein [Ilumatobacteraceae bacterium]